MRTESGANSLKEKTFLQNVPAIKAAGLGVNEFMQVAFAALPEMGGFLKVIAGRFHYTRS